MEQEKENMTDEILVVELNVGNGFMPVAVISGDMMEADAYMQAKMDLERKDPYVTNVHGYSICQAPRGYKAEFTSDIKQGADVLHGITEFKFTVFVVDKYFMYEDPILTITLDSPYGYMTTSRTRIENGTIGRMVEKYDTVSRNPVKFVGIKEVVHVPSHWIKRAVGDG